MKKTRKISYREMLTATPAKPEKKPVPPAPPAPVDAVVVETPAPVPARRTVRRKKVVNGDTGDVGDAIPAQVVVPEPIVVSPTSDQSPLQEVVAASEESVSVLSPISPSSPSEEDDFVRRATTPALLRELARQHEGRAELLLFRVGGEIFATALAAVDEAVELPDIHHLPEQPAAMLGVFSLRGTLVPVYDPARVLGVTLGENAAAALLVRGRDKRIALAVDDVDDVMELDLTTLRDAPGMDDGDGVLIGVARRGDDLVALLDADALVAACTVDRVLEMA